MTQDHVVDPGECLHSVAFENGFFWETLWNHPRNSRLKTERRDPGILCAGDVVHVPDLRKKVQSCSTGKPHRFRLKGVPARLRLLLVTENNDGSATNAASDNSDASVYEAPPYDPDAQKPKPLRNVAVRIDLPNGRIDGSTDGEGMLDIYIQPNARTATLFIQPGTPDERQVRLSLGGMDPVTEESGVRRRLSNLGFPCDVDAPADNGDSHSSDKLSDAILAFQDRFGLTPSGTLDDATRQKLLDVHGS